MRFAWLPILFLPLAATAQETSPDLSAPCSAPEYRQFDFWIGEWDVSSAAQPAGTNSIQPIHNGCALRETWQGAGEDGVGGSSLNAYDRATGRWHQTWVDDNGTLLLLDGGLVDGVMVMQGVRPARDAGGTTLHRISWTPNEDGTLRQLWEASQDDGGTWSILFDGLYTRRAEEQ